MGGGGEPPGANTRFDLSLKNLGKLAQDADWTTSVVYNGGHSNSEVIAKQVGGAKNWPVSKANINRQLATLKQKIVSGDLRKGDQLMIAISAHGLDQYTSEQTHSIVANDGLYNLDRIKEIRDLAEKKGVKLAIVDNTCYSGHSLKLGTNKTCVITSAGLNLGYNNAGDLMTGNMKAGENLEDVFLKSRNVKEGLSPGAPQISTDAGKKAFQTTSFLANAMVERNSLEKHLDGNNKDICSLQTPAYAKLARDMKKIEESQFTSLRSLVGLPNAAEMQKELAQAIANYEVERKKARTLFNKKNALNPKFCIDVFSSRKKARESTCGTMATFEKSYQLVKAQYARKPSPLLKNEMEDYSVMLQTESFKKWKAAQEAYNKAANGLFAKAMEVGKAERKIYDSLYSYYQKNSEAPNPCKDFEL